MKNKRLTTDRTHWSQSMCDIRIKPNLGNLTSKEKKIAKEIWRDIPQYRSAARSLATTGFYRVNHIDYTASLFTWKKGELETIASGITRHRITIIRNEYPHRNKYNPSIWENYCTGGYTTRIGLRRANISEEKRETASRMGRSHADYMGLESGNPKRDHDARVSMRNT